MRSLKLTCLLLCLASASWNGQAAAAKILKVLPHFLDQDGRHSVSPSLYDRDAYQAQLRKNPATRSALRFDVHWKTRELAPFKLRVELRGAAGTQATTALLEEEVKFSGWFSKWSSATIKGDEYKKFGELTAWRATLWQGDQLVAEQKSFLW